jgi:hypothetical protein
MKQEQRVMANRTERERLVSLLFGDTKLINLRCFRRTGTSAENGAVTSEQIATQICSAIEQRNNGTAIVSKSFNDDASKVDVRAIVANLK